MTGFNVAFAYESTSRIWDSFLFEGEKVFFRVFLAALKINSKKIMKGSFEDVMETLRTVGTTNTETLVKTAFNFSLSKTLVERLRQDYRNNPKQKYMLGISRRK